MTGGADRLGRDFLRKPDRQARNRGRRRVALSLAVVAIPFAVLTILALRQLRSIEDAFTGRELRAVQQYARVAAREFSYLVPQEEDELLQVLDLSSVEALEHSVGEADETFPAVAVFALDEDGRFMYPGSQDAVLQVPPFDLVLERRDELLACLAHDKPTRLALHDEVQHLGVSLFPWRAEGTTGVIGLCWDSERLSVWTETVALVTIPRGYTLELTDGYHDIVARHPDEETGPTPGGQRNMVAEYPLRGGIFRWWARVRPSDPDAVMTVVDRQVRLYTTSFVFLAVLTAVGLWILASVTLREGELARQKAGFAANVSHELRTPLTLIRASAEAMANRPDLERGRVERYLGIIDRETRRLGDLITNVLQYTRRTAADTLDRQKVHDLGALVKVFAEDYKEFVVEQGFQFTVSLPDTPLPVRVDADALQVVLVNLLDNAVKFSDAHKAIAIRVESDETHAVINVTDRGIGIAKEDQPHVFVEFFRAERGLLKRTRGTGIGLALVQRIVAAHGGRATVTSALGKGTTIAVYLPLNREPRDGQNSRR